MAVASLIIAIIAILIALGSVAYTRRQALANEALTTLEKARRHDDLTPELDVKCIHFSGVDVNLELELTGPTGLDRLDEVRVRIRNDRPDRGTPGPGSGLSTEQLAEVIWGPYRFNPAARDTDRLGREHGPFSLPRQEPYRLSLEPSIVPSWFTVPGMWRKQYEETPIRLEITCRREGYEPWVVLCEIFPIDPREAIARAMLR